MRIDSRRLDQLTSLRFFAAMMIVFHHSVGLFGFDGVPVNLGQGVSFFFVLSGFILTYVYPRLDSWPATRNFWKARVARIWPAYLVSLLLGCWLESYHWDTWPALAHVFMVQGWIPISTYYFSYNGVAWSVSTEFFFYLAFPALIYRWDRTWMLKLAAWAAMLLLMFWLLNAFAVPEYVAPGPGAAARGVTQHGLVYISPLTRIFEFMFGMCVALAWRRKPDPQWGPLLATALELAAVALCALCMWYLARLGPGINSSPFGLALGLWVAHCGTVFCFGALIYVLAHGRGKLSLLLSQPPLVLLGEISFSLYLLHRMMLTYYRTLIPELGSLSNPAAFAVFLGILLTASYLMWTLVEMPARRLIMGAKQIHGTPVMVRSWRQNLGVSRRSLLAGAVLACLVLFVYSARTAPNAISASQALEMTPAPLAPYAGTRFGDLFTLRGLDVSCAGEGMQLKLAWSGSRRIPARQWTNAVHLVDGAGSILGQADYFLAGAEAGDLWLETVLIPRDRLPATMTQLAIAVYAGSARPLPVDKGTRDWEGRRLLLPIGDCRAKP